MKVLKFGGTSLGSDAAIKSVAEIIQSYDDQLFVVVSAVSGVTNSLQEIADVASHAPDTCMKLVDDLIQKHVNLYETLTGEQESEPLEKIGRELKQICQGVGLTHELTPRSRDIILSVGERMSAIIVTSYLETLSVDAQLTDSSKVIITNDRFGCAEVDFHASESLLPDLDQLSHVNIFSGFIGGTKDGQITTLGRGGSDYSAAILAHLFDADVLEIWTDVDGIMTADPRLVKRSRLIDQLSYQEALELSHFGAKVIYKPSVQPVMQKGIPTKIKNTFNPSAVGTLISEDAPKQLIRGISSIVDVSLITLSGKMLVGVPSFSAELFAVLSDAEIHVVFITQSSSEYTITLGFHTEEVILAKKALEKSFKQSLSQALLDPIAVEDGLSLLALIGSNMQNQVGVSGTMFHILGRNGVSIKAISQGSSERNISAVIAKSDLDKALNVLHEGFFLSETKRINLFIIGVGNVGKAFLNQVSKQFTYLKEHHHLNVKAIGIANSRQMCFEQDGIRLSQWESRLTEGETYSQDQFLARMYEMNLRNCILIDATASEEVAGTYMDVLSNSISVVTPNKIAATRSMDAYSNLKNTARRFKSQFLFETNVCAGLPILSTLNDLVRSGDRMQRVEAVLSGTLNFIFNEYDGETAFCDVIKKAKDMGYSEPDPRLDLSGEDVMRKLLILVRESGFEMEMEQIEMQTFLPESCIGNDSLEAFYEAVTKAEPYFKSLYEKAKEHHCRLKMVATYADGKAQVKLQEISGSHPFYNLEGKDNIVLFYTERYQDQPMVIKGAGAGAEVTASGIFADVLRISQSD